MYKHGSPNTYVALGATLSQEDQQGNLRLVACASRKLSSAERNYPAHEKECLAVVDSLQRWRHYLLGAVQVIVHTDNITLKYLNTMKDTSPRMNRWLEKLSRFNFEIRHIPGTTNTAADALSRNLSLSSMDPKVMTTSRTKLKRFLRLSLQPVTGTAVPDTESSVNIDTDDWFPAYERTSYCKDFIANHVPKAGSEWHGDRFWREDKIIVPDDEAIRTAVVAAHHTGILQGHWGEAKTTEIVRRRFWFPGMPAFIQDFIKKCDTCQRIKADRHKQNALLLPLYLPELPWSSISIDWMRGLPPHQVGTTTYESILIVIDRCTNMVHLIPM